MIKISDLEKINISEFLENPEIDQFIGKKSLYYRTLWLKNYNKKNSIKSILTSANWNWGAFLCLCPVTWLAYRKMLGYWFVVILTCLSIFLKAYFSKDSTSYWIDKHIFFDSFFDSLFPIFPVVLLYGKNYYFLHTITFFEKIKDLSSERRGKLIAQKGGVSVLHAVIGTIFYFGLIFFSDCIATVLFRSITVVQ
jgi:hypothetical protein